MRQVFLIICENATYQRESNGTLTTGPKYYCVILCQTAKMKEAAVNRYQSINQIALTMPVSCDAQSAIAAETKT